MPSIRTPIAEKWDCHGCSVCCRGSTIVLDAEDLAQLRSQRWHEQAEFRGVKTVVRESLLGGRRVLAKRKDGSCVFLSDEGRCRIHELHGAEAKPAICRMFPLQFVALERVVNLTVLRSCPSAAADRGRPLQQHVGSLKKSGLAARLSPARAAPPPIAGGANSDWRAFLAAADTLANLITDNRLPMVRRLVHGLAFCSLLEDCKFSKLQQQDFHELMQMLAASAAETVGPFFQDRQPPSRAAASLFRQVGAHYMRSHPGFPLAAGWRQRWRMLWVSARFARGQGRVPAIHPGFPETTFQQLEEPLGPLPAEIARPLDRFFETQAASKQYALVGRRKSLVESFRTLAFAFPMALWLLRLATGEQKPTQEDVVDIVVALQRGRGMTALSRGAMALESKQQIRRLVCWYAR